MSGVVEKLKNIGSWFWEHKKTSIALLIVIFIIGLFITADIYQAEKKKAASEIAAKMAKANKKAGGKQTKFEQLQAQYIKEYGKPKRGFVWTEDGQLQAIGSLGKTPEDVTYTYVRSLSTLDFANAQRFGYKTQTSSTYEGFYNSDNEFTYNQNFLKGMYKQVLLSLKVNKTVDVTTFADYKDVVTLNVNVLDLSDKDFWKKDKNKIFKELEKYSVYEKDTTKMKQFLYKYVLNYYSSPKAKMTNVNLSFTLEQTIDNAWLVTNDSDLDAYAQYQDGEVVVDEILDQFDNWEAKNSMNNNDDDGNKSSSNSDDTFDGSSSSADELTQQDNGDFDNSGITQYNKNHNSDDSKDGSNDGSNDSSDNNTKGDVVDP